MKFSNSHYPLNLHSSRLETLFTRVYISSRFVFHKRIPIQSTNDKPDILTSQSYFQNSRFLIPFLWATFIVHRFLLRCFSSLLQKKKKKTFVVSLLQKKNPTVASLQKKRFTVSSLQEKKYLHRPLIFLSMLLFAISTKNSSFFRFERKNPQFLRSKRKTPQSLRFKRKNISTIRRFTLPCFSSMLQKKK